MDYLVTTSPAALATGWNPHLLRDAALESFGPKSAGCGGYETFWFQDIAISWFGAAATGLPQGAAAAVHPARSQRREARLV